MKIRSRPTRCQGCWQHYTVDLLIPDDLWKLITPRPDSDGGGLLCGPCIMRRLESFGRYGALHCDRGRLADTEASDD